MLALLRPPVIVALALVAAGCARTPEIAVVTPPPVYVTPPPAMPAGGYAGMPIPARLADGSYTTPNRSLSQAGSVWHLRAALNVAALACRGANETAVIAGYNAMLRTHAAELKSAQTTLSAEYKAGGGDWQDRYDDSMTRLYNFFSQSFARDDFCAAAAGVLAESATVAPAGLAAFATRRLPSLDQPFTDFYRAYDAWRDGQALARPVIAVAAAPVPTPTGFAAPAPAPAAAVAMRAGPRLTLDPATFEDAAASTPK